MFDINIINEIKLFIIIVGDSCLLELRIYDMRIGKLMHTFEDDFINIYFYDDEYVIAHYKKSVRLLHITTKTHHILFNTEIEKIVV